MLKYGMSTDCSNKWNETTLVSMSERWRMAGWTAVIYGIMEYDNNDTAIFMSRWVHCVVVPHTESVCVCLIWVSRHQIAIIEIHFGTPPTSLWEYTTTMTSSHNDVMPDKRGPESTVSLATTSCRGGASGIITSPRQPGTIQGQPAITLKAFQEWLLGIKLTSDTSVLKINGSFTTTFFIFFFARFYRFHDDNRENYISASSLFGGFINVVLWPITWPGVISQA